MQNLGTTITQTFSSALDAIILFIPRLIGAAIILIVGWIVAAILQKIVEKLLNVVRLDEWLQKAGVEKRGDRNVWSKVLSLIVFWTVIFFFLVPAVDSLNVARVTVVLNQLLAYIPNVFAAVIIAIVGLILANLSYQVVVDAAENMGRDTANLLANIAKYALLIVTGLIVMSQLGIASTIIQIIFAGFAFMLTLGGGLAIGLGGQDAVHDTLSQYMSKSNKSSQSSTAKKK